MGATLTSNPAVAITGSKFKVVSSVGTYLVYALGPSPITLGVTSGALRGSAPLTGVLRVAKLNSTAHETTLDTYAATYPTGVALDYTFSGNTGSMSFTWTTTGPSANLLLLSYPHHRCELFTRCFLVLTTETGRRLCRPTT